MHLVYVIAPGGGPEAHVRTLAPELEKCGHQVSVVFTVPPARVRFGFPPSVRVMYAPPAHAHYYLAKAVGGFRAFPRRLRAWEIAWAVRCALDEIDREDKMDIVEVTEGGPILLLRKRWPVVVRAHGSDWTFRLFCDEGDRREDRWLIAMEAKQFREARAVSALSEHLADHLSEFCRFPRDRIQVIPYPIDTLLFSPPEIPKTDCRSLALMTVGRLEKRKGVDVLLRALPTVWQRFPDLKLYLLGGEAGISQRQLRALLPEEKREHVIFPGFVDHDRLPEYYRRATVYVTPTLYETFAYTILEAMACGLPVVASRVGAIPELVDDGATGLLVPPRGPDALADAILSLLGDPARRERMGKCGREKAIAEYDLNKILNRTLDFYQKVLSL